MSIIKHNRFVDYTVGKEGCAYSRAGVIARCPVCGRLGERRTYRGGGPYVRRYVHKATIDERKLKVTESCRIPSEDPAAPGDLLERENVIGLRVAVGLVLSADDAVVTYADLNPKARKPEKTIGHIKLRASGRWLIHRPTDASWEELARELKVLTRARKLARQVRKAAAA